MGNPQSTTDRRLKASTKKAQFSAHFAANESISVDGDTAEGQGTYLQALVFDGQAIWTAGRYRIDFLRVDGAWKIRISASRTSSSLRMMKTGYCTSS